MVFGTHWMVSLSHMKTEKMFNSILKVGLFLFALAQFCFADPYVVRKFQTTQWPTLLDTLGWIHPASKITHAIPPEQVRSGLLTMRAKLASEEYGLFYVTLDSSAYQHLKAYVISEFDFSEILRTRFFAANLERPENDIPIVFFDSQYVYISDFPAVYYSFVGEWKRITPENNPIGHVWIESEPSGATVFIGEKAAGVTPWMRAINALQMMPITLKHPECFPQTLVLNANINQMYQANITLTQKFDGELSSESFFSPRDYYRRDSLDLRILDRRWSEVKSSLDTLGHRLKSLDSNFSLRYPLIASGPAEEKPEQFVLRNSMYTRDRMFELDMIRQLFEQRIGELKIASDSLFSFLREKEDRVQCDTVRLADLKELEWKNQSDSVYLTGLAKEAPWVFKAELSCAKCQAKLSNPAPEKALICGMPIYAGQLTNRIVYLAPETFSILNQESNVSMQGSFFQPKAVISHEVYERALTRKQIYMASRIEKVEREKKIELMREKKLEKERIVQREISRHKIWRRSLVTGGMLTGVGMGLLAYTISEKADDSYRKYQTAQTRSDAQAYHEDTDKLDRKASIYTVLSGVSFTVAFISFSF